MKAVFFVVVATLAGCGGSDDVDPIGTIKANVLYGTGGTCSKNGTLAINVTIQPSNTGEGYFVTVGNPDLMQVGSVVGCDASACTIDVDQRKVVGAVTERWHAEVEIATDDTVSGAGEYTNSMTSCTQPITITGTHTPEI